MLEDIINLDDLEVLEINLNDLDLNIDLEALEPLEIELY